MRKHISLFAATAMALGGAGLVYSQQAQQDGVRAEGEFRVEREQQRVEVDRADQQHADGLVGVTEREANNIRGTLSTATEAALEGDLRSMAQRLTTSDEARLAAVFDRDDEQFQQLGQQIRDAFEARYGQDFSIDDREAVYPPTAVSIRSGLTQEAMLARGEEMEQGQQMQQDQQQLQRDQQPGVDQERDGMTGRIRDGVVGDQPRPEADENLVTVIFPSHGELQELHVPLVNEGTITDAWRIDVPLHVDADTIRTNLQQNFNKALQAQEQWPQEINEAYRMATHIVMLSLYDVKDDAEARPAGLQEQIDQQRDQLHGQIDEQRDQLREQRDQLREQTDQQ
jgi:hypothetical protein